MLSCIGGHRKYHALRDMTAHSRMRHGLMVVVGKGKIMERGEKKTNVKRVRERRDRKKTKGRE